MDSRDVVDMTLRLTGSNDYWSRGEKRGKIQGQFLILHLGQLEGAWLAHWNERKSRFEDEIMSLVLNLWEMQMEIVNSCLHRSGGQERNLGPK